MSEIEGSPKQERFPRVRKIAATIGLAAFGPAALYGVIDALIAGEVRHRGTVIATAKEEPFEFYTLILVSGLAASLVAVLSLAFLALLLKGRASRTE
ncbi:hypothetical protein B0E45_31660 [Sinorhizobium sp. A49]|uniref:hypothetical protein n=1 Tax=Sinorhizobium sp. A49 TaxID=1945861 RepID=UPI000985916D|nr:hypothetical protein [Sinorhizobium sp. A49]OOG61966.1 hypothetical protein B0E45_31660 [Sinorhizobium sp. A49]